VSSEANIRDTGDRLARDAATYRTVVTAMTVQVQVLAQCAPQALGHMARAGWRKDSRLPLLRMELRGGCAA